MAALLFNYSFTTRIHDIDAAGVMFFARYFYHIHDAYEEFLNQRAINIKQLLNSDTLIPIRHTETDFKAPIVLNETIHIEISLLEMTEEHFILHYHLTDAAGKTRAKAITHHVCLDKYSRQRKTLPDSIQQLLSHNVKCRK